MAEFGEKSKARLATCDDRLVQIFRAVNDQRPCTILEGVRSQEDQDRDFEKGVSRLKWPHGKHNVQEPGELCKAVDVKPDDMTFDPPEPPERWKEFADQVQAVADSLGILIRWGGAWAGTYPNPPGVLNDLDHFELAA